MDETLTPQPRYRSESAGSNLVGGFHAPETPGAPFSLQHPPSRFKQAVWEVLSSKAPSRAGQLSVTGAVYHEPLQWTRKANRVFEIFILALITLNVVFVLVDTARVPASNLQETTFERVYNVFEIFSTVVFTIEYVLRLYSCTAHNRYNKPILGRLKWMLKPLSLLDLICLSFFYLDIIVEVEESGRPTFRGATVLRAMRLLRVFALVHKDPCC